MRWGNWFIPCSCLRNKTKQFIPYISRTLCHFPLFFIKMLIFFLMFLKMWGSPHLKAVCPKSTLSSGIIGLKTCFDRRVQQPAKGQNVPYPGKAWANHSMEPPLPAHLPCKNDMNTSASEAQFDLAEIHWKSLHIASRNLLDILQTLQTLFHFLDFGFIENLLFLEI